MGKGRQYIYIYIFFFLKNMVEVLWAFKAVKSKDSDYTLLDLLFCSLFFFFKFVNSYLKI